MRIIPVIDLRAGVVVRGMGGKRREYAPIVSRLTSSSQPAAVAMAFQTHFHFSDVYLADLDAIAGATPAVETYAALRALGLRLWLDAGIRDTSQAARLLEAGVDVLILGLETLNGPDVVRALVRSGNGAKLAFSLDLKNGQPLGDRALWKTADAWTIAAQAADCGIGQLIVLDLARVGMNTGTGTESICSRLAASYPAMNVIAGGGIRNRDDLIRLKSCGVGGVLLASSLHDGHLEPDDLREL